MNSIFRSTAIVLALFLMQCQTYAQITIDTFQGVVVQIKTDFTIDESFKVTAKSTTCQPVSIAPGVFVVKTPGKHLLDVDVLSFKQQVWESQLVEINVGGPDQPDEDDEEVKPDPVAPDPIIPEPVTPTKLTNPKVLFVVESGTQAQLPPSQASVLFAKKVRDELKSKGVEWRRLDPDAEFVDQDSPYKPIIDRSRKSMPWMVIFGDEGIGLEEPLSPNVEAFLRTVDQYIGPSTSKPAPKKPTTPPAKPLSSVLVPVYETRVVPRLVSRRVPRTICRIVLGRQICETVYDTVTETVYETQLVEVAN